ncbi:MAG: hypothetical protein V4565_09375 [Bacteroidota bacterium]
MKKICILFVVLLSLQCFSQKDYSRYYNSWRLGLNIGGAWQTADYYSCWGMAGGFTLEKGLHENNTNFFSFAIRARYLAANTYGMDHNRNYDVKINDAYNGKYDPIVNFVDSVPLNRQYVFDNYKMTLGEGSLELQLTFNRLRERTHVLLNLWGGVGFTSYRTKSDLLDGDKKRYNFSLVDSTGNRTKALNSYNGLIDKNYESYAYGSRNGNLVTFSPSAGIGLGYQFSPGFSMLWEYKLTLPQGTNADLLDGKISLNNDNIGGNNDYYHYTGLNFVFTLRAKKKKQPTAIKNETVYTNTIVPTNTVIIPSGSIAPSNSVIANQQQSGIEQKPIISLIAPPTKEFLVSSQQYKIAAKILNVKSSNNIQFKLNGIINNGFTFNIQTKMFEYNAKLNKGNNSIQITASNNSGSDTKLTSVVYEQPSLSGNPPEVAFINPPQPNTASATKTYIVRAQVLNVIGKNNISVYFNGLSTPFSFNAENKQISFTAQLNEGSNSINITANNTFGEDTKVSNIIFNENKPTGVPPSISLMTPATETSTTDNFMYNFKLMVLNVASKNEIIMMLNGNQVNTFSYDLASRIAELPINLAVGDNTLTVKANNAFGSDAKTIRIKYQSKEKNPPVLTVITPSNSVATSQIPNYTFSAKVTNVTLKSQVEVRFNGNLVPNFIFNLPNIICPVTLIPGNNVFEIVATNADGKDAKKVDVKYRQKEIVLLPEVNLINPASSINNTTLALYKFKLGILNVNSKSDIEVIFNGDVQSNFTYDNELKELIFQTNLSAGNNTLTVKATNSSGSDSKRITVAFARPIEIKSPPLVTITTPSLNLSTAKNSNYVFNATITNMQTTSGITVTFNGSNVTNYTFDGFNLTYKATLVSGNNAIDIKAVNNDGTDAKNAIVNFKPIVKPPSIIMIKPVNTPTVNTESFSFNFKAFNVDQNQIEVKLNGVTISSLNFVKPECKFTATLIEGINTLTVKAINSDGMASKIEKVVYTVLKDSVNNTDNVRMMTICHIPPGNKENPQTLSIPISAWPAHLAHGDKIGECPSKNDTLKVKGGGKNINNNSGRGNGTQTVEPNNAPK